jgi:catechol 2,3-dioxygenase-like lactoylglutathione lyase family enzyme
LAVPDVERSATWWTDVMGFERWMEPEGWVFVRRGRCSIMLGECPDAIAPADLGDHQYFAYIELDDVDSYHAMVSARGGEVIFPPSDKPWKMREMGVRTPDGHRVMFGQDI